MSRFGKGVSLKIANNVRIKLHLSLVQIMTKFFFQFSRLFPLFWLCDLYWRCAHAAAGISLKPQGKNNNDKKCFEFFPSNKTMSGSGGCLCSPYILFLTTMLVTQSKGNTYDNLLFPTKLIFKPRSFIRRRKKKKKRKRFVTMKQKGDYVYLHSKPCSISSFSALFKLYQSTGICCFLTTHYYWWILCQKKHLSFCMLYMASLFLTSQYYKETLTLVIFPYNSDKFSDWTCCTEEAKYWNDTNKNLYYFLLCIS